jgi:anti-sigma regulatory factor (Ser/Thr protein kinase)
MCCGEVIEREPSLGTFSESRCVHLALSAEPKAPAAARAFVSEVAADEDQDLVDALALLTSEVVTNAVIHARTPIEIGVARDEDRVLVAVGDRNLARPEQQPYRPERSGGRGLMIVRSLSDDWGVTTYENGKSVWFTMRRTGGKGKGGS